MELIDIVLGMLLLGFCFQDIKPICKKNYRHCLFYFSISVSHKIFCRYPSIVIWIVRNSGRIGFILAFIVIVVSITLVQSVLYRLLIKNMVDALWNKILGLLVGVIEGALCVSIGLIVLSIYLHLPPTKANSELYKPLKNFSAHGIRSSEYIFARIQFYQQILKFASEEMNEWKK